jgi:NAD(P)-dependent dehydrogenase (short-subunit alcohol dehydrogenase family)
MTTNDQTLTILVTGASRGIGRAIACALAGRGARIAVHYQGNLRGAGETLAALAGTGRSASNNNTLYMLVWVAF